MMNIFKMKKERCGLCGSKLGTVQGVLQYKAVDDNGDMALFSMAICKECADDMDGSISQETPDEVREMALRR
jgi:hypothetical protein